jgi:GST-like protein
MEITVYGAKSPWPFLKGLIRENRPIWFLEETGIPYTRVSLDPTKGDNKSDQYTQLNRFQKVPTVVIDQKVYTQSAAVLNQLALKTGQLLPKDPEAQAKHLEWMFYCMSDVESHAIQLGTLLHMTDEKNAEHAKWMLNRAEQILARALNYLNSELEGKSFLMGKTFFAADILLGCCLYPIRDHDLVKSRPNIDRLLRSYFERPAFKRTIELNGT